MDVVYNNEDDGFAEFISTYSWIISGVHYLVLCIYDATMISSKWQATFGKHIMGLVVVDELGMPLTFSHALGRSIMKSISQLLFYIGYFVMLLSKKRQTFHDTVAMTLVIKPNN